MTDYFKSITDEYKFLAREMINKNPNITLDEVQSNLIKITPGLANKFFLAVMPICYDMAKCEYVLDINK